MKNIDIATKICGFRQTLYIYIYIIILLFFLKNIIKLYFQYINSQLVLGYNIIIIYNDIIVVTYIFYQLNFILIKLIYYIFYFLTYSIKKNYL